MKRRGQSGWLLCSRNNIFLHETDTEFFAVGLEDLFDLFKLDGLDVGLLHVLSL